MNQKNIDAIKKEIKMNLNLVEGDEYRDTLLALCSIDAEVLVKTLGPYACTTTIDDGVTTYSTKDGWSVLSRLHFGDAIQDTLNKFIQKISFALNSRVGDGTTTAVIAANEFMQIFNDYREELSQTNTFVRQADLLDKIRIAKDNIISHIKSSNRLKNVVKTENGYEDIYKIAYVSSNRNDEISQLIKDLYDKTDNPNIYVDTSDTSVTYSTIQRGYKIDAHLLWDKFYANKNGDYVITDTTKIFIFDHNVKFNDHFAVMKSIIDLSSKAGNPVVVFAPDFDDSILASISAALKPVVDAGGIPNIALVQLTLTNSALKQYAQDFALLANASIFNFNKVKMFNYGLKHAGEEDIANSQEFKDFFPNEAFDTPDEIIEHFCGSVNKITLSNKFVMIEDFSRDTVLYKNTLAEIQADYDKAREKFDMHGEVLSANYMTTHLRLIKFIGDTGVIYVGGDSELNKKCTKDAVDDAVLACRSAFENGYIRGLNLETITSAAECYEDENEDTLLKDCYAMIAATFIRTSFNVMMNKFLGESYVPESYNWGDGNPVDPNRSLSFFEDQWSFLVGSSALKHGMFKIISACANNDLGYDIVTEEYEEAGKSVINSVATDIEILNATTSILSLLLSSNQLLSINKRFDKKASKQYTLDARREDAMNTASGIATALRAHGCVFFPPFPELSNDTNEFDDVLPDGLDYDEDEESCDCDHEE